MTHGNDPGQTRGGRQVLLHRRGHHLLLPYVWLLVLGGPLSFIVYALLHTAARDATIHWAHPWALLLGCGAVLAGWARFHLRRSRAPALRFSRVADLVRVRRGMLHYTLDVPEVLRVVCVALMAVALARPQVYSERDVEVESIDIMVALDLSKSMEERDMRYNRLDAGQRTIRNFLKQVPSDRVGLVVFAQAAMLQCPLTLDHQALDHIIADQSIGDLPFRGTAIGDALALALASLRRSDSKSKVVILLSDGESNWTTELSPAEARELAKAMGVKVFTILLGRESSAAGRRGGGHPVNPALLEDMANDTGGLFFRAPDDQALAESFARVRETLELTRHRVRVVVPDSDLYPRLVWLALLLLSMEVIMRLTRWRRFP